MSDRVSSFTITFDGEAGTVKSVLAGLKSQIKSDVSDIQATADKLDIFKNLQSQAKDAASALFTTKQRVEDLRTAIAAIQSAGGVIGRDLANSLKDAERAAASARKEFDSSRTQLTNLRAELTKAGVDTRNLAAEQTRLAAAARSAAAAALEQQQKQALGFKTIRDVQPELTKLQQAYFALRDSGKLSFTELSVLQTQYQRKVTELRGEVGGLGNVFSSVRANLTAFAAAGAAVGLSIGTIISAVHAAQNAANTFNLGITQIGTIANISKEQLDGLAEGARRLAREVGFDVTEGVKALYEIIRSGIPADNSLAVLAASADLAKASLTDINTAAKLGATILNGFGRQASELPKIFDQLFQATKDGGPTIAELANGLGEIIPIARSARIPLDELVAALTVLRKAGLDTPTALASLTRVISGLADPANTQHLQQLGIEVRGLAGTLQQVSSRNLDLDQLKAIFPDARALKAVAALTQSAGGLAIEMERIAGASGGVKAAVDALDQTPHERIERFAAAVKDLAINIGDTIGSGTGLFVVLTNLANALNSTGPKTRAAAAAVSQFSIASSGAAGPLGALLAAMVAVGNGSNLLAVRQALANAELTRTAGAASGAATALRDSLGSILADVQAQIGAVEKRLADTRQALAGFVTELGKETTAAQQAAQGALTNLNAVTQASLAALDTERLSQLAKATAAQDIERKAAADRLKIITDGSKLVLAAFDAEAKARIDIARRAGESTKAIEVDIQNGRKAILQKSIDDYRAHIAQLTSLEAGYVQQVKAIDQERVEVNRSIENQISALFAQRLGAYEVYGQKVSEIDQLLSASRKALLEGDIDQAKKFAQQAIGLVSGITSAVQDGGKEVVTQEEAQNRAIGRLREAQEVLNKAFAAQGDSAKKGADQTAEALKTAKGKLDELSTQYNALAEQIAQGLAIRITIDTAAIDELTKKLEALGADKDRLLQVKIDLEGVRAQAEQVGEFVKKGLTAAAEAGSIAIEQALAKVRDNAPELTVKIDEALSKVSDVRIAIKTLEEAVTVNVTVTDNVDAVRKDILSLNGLNTDSFHTIHERVVQDRASGGLIGALRSSPFRGVRREIPEGVQAFARGGAVFRRPSWNKVPGVGSGDTVPAALQAGSYVVRKAASQYYGDAIMSRVARGYAFGGNVSPAPNTKPTGFFGDINPDAQESIRDAGEISPPTLPTDHNKLVQAISRYVFDVRQRALVDDYFFWRDALGALDIDLKQYERAPTDANLEVILRRARGIGLNLGASKGIHTGFDIDGRSWHKVGRVSEFAPAGLSSLGDVWAFFNRGGAAGTDTVPAMLTPGEFVVSKPAVDRFGVGLLEAINQMRVPKMDLAHLFEAPRPQRFAIGGMVGDVANRILQGPPAGSQGHQFTVNLNLPVKDLYNEAAIRRYLLPALNNILSRNLS